MGPTSARERPRSSGAAARRHAAVRENLDRKDRYSGRGARRLDRNPEAQDPGERGNPRGTAAYNLRREAAQRRG